MQDAQVTKSLLTVGKYTIFRITVFAHGQGAKYETLTMYTRRKCSDVRMYMTIIICGTYLPYKNKIAFIFYGFFIGVCEHYRNIISACYIVLIAK